MKEIEKIMEAIRNKLSGYRVETTTIQEAPEPVMLVTNPESGYACGYLVSNIQELLSKGFSPEEIAEHFCNGILETEQAHAHLHLEDQLDTFEKAKDKVFFRLASPLTEKEILQHVVHMPFLDMEIVFYMELPGLKHDGDDARPLVSTTLAEHWNKSATEIFQAAVKNNMAKKPASLKTPMECHEQALQAHPDIDEELAISEEEIQFLVNEAPIYILTCETRYAGTACMAYPGTLAMIAESLKDDLYLLPSGIHQWTLIPGKHWIHGMENGAAQAFVELPISREEYLTKNAYHYKRETDGIEIIQLPIQVRF